MCATAELQTPVGTLWVAGDARRIIAVSWEYLEGNGRRDDLDWFVTALEGYLFHGAQVFPGGLGFDASRPVWLREPQGYQVRTFIQQAFQSLVDIPYGCLRSYGDLARTLGNRYLARAIGNVCASNPLPIVIPCHRVVGAHSLGGYTGGLDKKRYLLSLEGH